MIIERRYGAGRLHLLQGASMGPRTYIRGNVHGKAVFGSRPASFNGAADLHPRKSGTRQHSFSVAVQLQMGPRTYIRGNNIGAIRPHYTKRNKLYVSAPGDRQRVKSESL
jgi:hypothetical protein